MSGVYGWRTGGGLESPRNGREECLCYGRLAAQAGLPKFRSAEVRFVLGCLFGGLQRRSPDRRNVKGWRAERQMARIEGFAILTRDGAATLSELLIWWAMDPA
jgi:hypothetical protein